MNNSGLRKAQGALYKNLTKAVIRALLPSLGLPASRETREAMAKATFPLLSVGRNQIRDLQYRDYVQFVNDEDPVPKMELGRFTEETWSGALDDVFGLDEDELVSSEDLEDLGMRADSWARDAEWGQRQDSAKNDPRIGRIARVDFTPPTCPFCTLLNSRGAVYRTVDTAAATLHAGDTCELVFVRNGESTYPGSEHTAEAEARYKAAVKAAESGNTSEILKALNDQHPDRPEGRVKATVSEAVAEGKADKVRQTKARIEALEKSAPVSETAKSIRAAQLKKQAQILSALEAGS